MKHTLFSLIIFTASTALSPAFADNDKVDTTAQNTALQEALAKKKCKTGTPILKEVTKTVHKMVAGRMIPTAVRETKVVCS